MGKEVATSISQKVRLLAGTEVPLASILLSLWPVPGADT